MTECNKELTSLSIEEDCLDRVREIVVGFVDDDDDDDADDDDVVDDVVVDETLLSLFD